MAEGRRPSAAGPVLRPYQREAIDAVYAWVSANDGHCLIVLPTGSGKSLVMGTLASEALENAPGSRILILAHRKELITQNMRAVATAMPLGRIGVYSAGLKRKDTSDPVIVAGIQSIAKKPYAVGAFDLVLVDEAHLVPTDDFTMYRKLVEALRIQNPHVRFVGLTATPYRLTTGLLHRGKNALFTDICYDAPVKDLIRDGYLCPLISKATLSQLSTAGVATRGGEFVPGALERAVDVENVTTAVVHEMVALFAERNKWVAFCSGVAHAEHVAEALRQEGISAASVHGELSPIERTDRLADFKAGRLRALTSMDVLTTGWDEPAVDAIALLRPTKSTGLYCLDEETEILTAQGWKGVDQVLSDDLVAAPDPSTLVTRWVPILNYIARAPLAGEQLVTYRSPHLDFAVSDKHRMVWRARPRSAGTEQLRIDTADMLARRRSEFELPVASIEQLHDAPLTDDEIRFVGWVMTDGTINQANDQITIYQSERYPEHLEEIRRMLAACGFKYTEASRKASDTYGDGHHRMHRFTISRGTPRGRDSHLSGWGRIASWVHKDLSPALEQLSCRQFDILVHTIHLGDGTKQRGQSWTPRSFHISTGNKWFADRLQALAVTRGWACNQAQQGYNKHPLYVLHLRKNLMRSIGGNSAEDRSTLQMVPATGRLWCVENEVGTLITRRRGKVLVTGNCQMVGRGFRLHPSKANTLVLDFARNVETHGPVDAIEIRDKESSGGGGDASSCAPTKSCPTCRSIALLSAKECADCGYEFPPPPPTELETSASTARILSTEPVVTTWHEVTDVQYHHHQSRDTDAWGMPKAPTLRVEYYHGYRRIAQEWVCLEHDHGSFAGRKAAAWWNERAAEGAPPTSIEEALARVDELLKPTEIGTRPDGRWTRVVEYRYAGKRAEGQLPRACWSCVYLLGDRMCTKWNAEPPADVQKIGCDAWSDDDDDDLLPF